MTISLSLKPLVLVAQRRHWPAVSTAEQKTNSCFLCVCAQHGNVFAQLSPFFSIPIPFSLSHSLSLWVVPMSKSVALHIHIEKGSPAPVVALAVKWLTGAIMSPRLCANFVLVLVRATIPASPQCEAYILRSKPPSHTTYTTCPSPFCRTYQSAVHTLTERILISAWSLQSRRGSA